MALYPVILCGGSGTRLWPLSRKSYPKQFVNLLGDLSLFQQTALRFGAQTYAPPTIVINGDYRFVVTEQLLAVDVDPGAILIEPTPRNTAPAILAAALYLQAQDPDALMLVAPSDHVIADTVAFHAAVAAGIDAADAGALVTFGITPDHPAKGYGYLELNTCPDGNTPQPLRSFVEKPDASRAAEMLESGGFMWNAGIFLTRADALIAAFETHSAAQVSPARAAVRDAKPDLGFLRLAAEPWSELEAISIDYAIMEKADNLIVVPMDPGWSDLGDWEAVWRAQKPDPQGVATMGNVTQVECDNVLLRSENPDQHLVGLGLSDIVAIAMPDAVLIAHKSRTQDVGMLVPILRDKKLRQADALPRDFRPWGWFDRLVMGERFQVKRIVVNPGAALSLQSHVHRSEHWIVVQGTARVTIDETVQLVTEDQSVYVPLGAVHRMENPGKTPMVLIEVQTGNYLGEDDIVRYEDLYARQ